MLGPGWQLGYELPQAVGVYGGLAVAGYFFKRHLANHVAGTASLLSYRVACGELLAGALGVRRGP